MFKNNRITIAALILPLVTLAACGIRTDTEELNVPDSRLAVSGMLATQWNELALFAVRAGTARPTVTAYQLYTMSTAMYDAISMYDQRARPSVLDPAFRQPVETHTDANREAAASQAAYQMLKTHFPEFESETGYFETHLNNLGHTVYAESDIPGSQAYGTDPDALDPAQIGFRAAQAVRDMSRNDGSNFENGFQETTSLIYPESYTPVNSPDPIADIGVFGANFDPNHWEPLRVPTGTTLDHANLPTADSLNLDSYGDQQFLTPHWGAVTPFALSHGAELRPSPPPQYGSDAPYIDALGRTSTHHEAYLSQFSEVIEISASLTDREKSVAEFWADGPRTESPPGHWNQLTHGIVHRDNLDFVQAVRLYFTLNAALHDAAVATWETKRHYDFIRPASAIRFLFQGQSIRAWGGPDLGTQMIQGEDWSPFQILTFVTPPFPEYVSGHSTFSRSAAEVLMAFTGSDRLYDGITRTTEDIDNDGELDLLGEYTIRAGSSLVENGPAVDIALRWNTLIDAADEAGRSRLYGGIHIQDGDLRGRELGMQIGQRVFAKAQAMFNES